MRFWIPVAAAQVLALAVLAHRFLQKGGNIALSAKPAGLCGHLKHLEYVITSRHVVSNAGVGPAAVRVKQGRIAEVAHLNGKASQENLTEAAFLKFGLIHILDYGDLIISPGLLDTHVHFNEPGRDHWEGFETGSKAAAAGGTTAVILMPLNALPAITTQELLIKKMTASKGKLWADVGFWGGLVPDNAANHSVLQGLLDAGALGFKSFMSPSGVVDFGSVEQADIEAALPFLKAQGAPYYIHAELPDATAFKGDVRKHANWESARPPAWEQNAIQLLLKLLAADKSAATPGFQLHIAHLSDTTSLPAITEAQRKGLPISVETCPHYLNFASEEVPDGDTSFKCAPPIRGMENREALWKAVARGAINLLASDHSPSPPEMKLLEEGDFSLAWGGIAALQYNLPATWDGMRKRGLGPEHLAKLWSEGPAKLAGLERRKGSIAPGLDADFVVWDPDRLADTSQAALQHRHKLTPYRGAQLLGHVVATFVQGHQVFTDDQLLAPKPCGSLLLRGSLAPPQA